MRILVACVGALFVAGCSWNAGQQPTETMPTLTPSNTSAKPSPSTSTTGTTATTTRTTPSPVAVPTSAPEGGTPIAEVMAWVQAGTAADADDYDEAVRDN